MQNIFSLFPGLIIKGLSKWLTYRCEEGRNCTKFSKIIFHCKDIIVSFFFFPCWGSERVDMVIKTYVQQAKKPPECLQDSFPSFQWLFALTPAVTLETRGIKIQAQWQIPASVCVCVSGQWGSVWVVMWDQDETVSHQHIPIDLKFSSAEGCKEGKKEGRRMRTLFVFLCLSFLLPPFLSPILCSSLPFFYAHHVPSYFLNIFNSFFSLPFTSYFFSFASHIPLIPFCLFHCLLSCPLSMPLSLLLSFSIFLCF